MSDFLLLIKTQVFKFIYKIYPITHIYKYVYNVDC